MMLINDLLLRTRAHESQIQAAISRVISRGWFVLGPEVQGFEEAFARYLGIAHCISVANGTDAIELGLRALGVTAGDKVATVANAGMYSTSAISAIGAEPYFVDISLETCNVTLLEIERAISVGVKAVVATHLYGLAIPEIREISDLCRKKEVRLLEDCAQAHGASLYGKRVGTFGDAASFSFYPTKNLGALGDGGAVVTQSAELAAIVNGLRQYGWTQKYQCGLPGARNSRLDEMQAAVLSEFLPKLDEANERRRQVASKYNKAIKNPNVITPNHSGLEYVAHLYVVRCSNRDRLRNHLREADIASDVHYPIPDYRQVVFRDKWASLSLSNTEKLAAEVLTLPCYPEMTDEQVDQVVSRINAWRM